MLSSTRTTTYLNYLEINFLWNYCITEVLGNLLSESLGHYLKDSYEKDIFGDVMQNIEVRRNFQNEPPEGEDANTATQKGT